MRSLRRQRGVALLVALLTVALATVLIAALLDRGELALARTRNLLRTQQAEAYAQGMDAYAVGVLTRLVNQGTDNNASPWALPLPPQEVPGGGLAATMRDRNGCFNLNNLAGAQRAQWRSRFEALLLNLGLNKAIGEAVEGWLAADASTREAGFYLAQPVAYRPRGGLFVHESELRLVRGIDGAAYARLAPHVCALPAQTKLNVNTATVPLLMAMSGKTQAEAERLWNGGQAHFNGVEEFLAAIGKGAGDPLAQLVDVRSTHFLLRGEVLLDGVPFTFHSLIERGRGGVRVIQRGRGADLDLVAAAPLPSDEAMR